MRKFKKITAAAAAALMAASLSIPMTITASATDVSVDTASDAETHTYKAYQIFTGTYDATLGLTVTGWGSGINVAGLIADSAWTGFVVEDAVEASGTEGEEGYTPAKAAVTIGTITNDADGAATAAQKIEKINSNSAKADALARVIAKYITTSSTTLSNTAVDLDAGYYIVTDTYTSSDTDGTKSDSISKYILKVSGESTAITISPKKYKPSVTKKVWENQDDNVNNIAAYTDGSETAKNWNDVADYSIGDEIKFKLYGTLPSNLNSYTNGYKYVFHDEIDSQFTLIDGDDDSFVDVVVKIGDSVASGYKVKQTGNSFTVTFDNILSGNTISDPVNTLVTVEYSARLNNTANIGSTGQENKVYLEYSNNPNWDGNGTQTTDETPRDKVVVFTYEIDNTKIDGATKATLAGATFRLKN